MYYRLIADDVSFPLLQALTRAYQERRPWASFTVEEGNTRLVGERLSSARARLAAAASLPSPNDGNGWFTDLALDGVVIIVNAQNPLETLAVSDARAIFAGERNQWTDYNASGLSDIKVAVREGSEATRQIFDRNIMGARRLTLEVLELDGGEVEPAASTATAVECRDGHPVLAGAQLVVEGQDVGRNVGGGPAAPRRWRRG